MKKYVAFGITVIIALASYDIIKSYFTSALVYYSHHQQEASQALSKTWEIAKTCENIAGKAPTYSFKFTPEELEAYKVLAEPRDKRYKDCMLNNGHPRWVEIHKYQKEHLSTFKAKIGEFFY
jgi:hypothetical protein